MVVVRAAAWWVLWMVAGAVGFLLGFIAAFGAIGVTLSFLVADVDATMEGPLAFAVALTVVFAAAGAGMGTLQWLLLRKDVVHGGAWIVLLACAFALVSLTFNALVAVAGEAHLDVPAGRAANEAAHTIGVGVVFAAASWVVVGRPNGALRERWLILTALAFPATGFTVWGLEVALDASGGDVNPLAMLVLGALTGAAWRPIVVQRSRAGREPARAGSPAAP